MNVFIIEDDEQTRGNLVKALSDAGHAVESTGVGIVGLARATAEAFDVIVVDRMMPDLDGLKLVKAVRRAGVTTPILMLTAMSAIEDRVDGLQGGADDYLSKPFAFAELAARLDALSRRSLSRADATKLTIGDLSLDRLRRVVLRGAVVIDLQPREFQILELLALNAGRLVTRSMLLEQVWGFRFDPGTNIVETHMSRLRFKLGGDDNSQIIHTVRGQGYIIHDAD